MLAYRRRLAVARHTGLLTAESRKAGVQPQVLADDGHQHVNRDFDPSLSLHGVLAGTEEGRDAQMLWSVQGMLIGRTKRVTAKRNLEEICEAGR